MTHSQQVLLSILHDLKPYRGYAPALIVMVETLTLSDVLISSLLTMLRKAAAKVENQQQKALFEKSVNLIEQIQEQEKTQRAQDDADAEHLLDHF